ncbi:MAG: hypothetical protein ACR2JX_04960, partial [Mycobacteriales bacterium]
MYSFQYVSGLKEEVSRVPVAGRGRFWADHVLTAPLDGDTEGWAARDVSLGTYMADYTYRDVVLAAFADAAMDPVIARDFLTVLDEHNNVPHERIPDGLSATIATRILRACFETGWLGGVVALGVGELLVDRWLLRPDLTRSSGAIIA